MSLTLRNFIIVLGVGILLLLSLAPFDEQLTFFVAQHDIPKFRIFMDQSLFEGESFGGSDIGTIAVLVTFIFYLVSEWFPHISLLRQVRTELGFVLFTSMVSGITMVHGLKNFLGRARPYAVTSRDGLEFSHWFEFGPYFTQAEWGQGSFPSGHTTTALITAAFLIFAPHLKARKIAAPILGLLVVCYTILMAMARMMAMQHWLTDTVASVVFTVSIFYASYHFILRVPDQRNPSSSWKPSVKVWELKLFGWIFLTTLSFLAVVSLLQMLIKELEWAKILGLGFGCILLFFSAKRTKTYYQSL